MQWSDNKLLTLDTLLYDFILNSPIDIYLSKCGNYEDLLYMQIYSKKHMHPAHTFAISKTYMERSG